MTSEKLQRRMRRFAEGLGLTYVGTVDGRQHVVMHFAAGEQPIQVLLPRGQIGESGRLVRTIQSQIKLAARNNLPLPDDGQGSSDQKGS